MERKSKEGPVPGVGRALGLTAWLVCSGVAAHAQPAPVLAGAWDVQTLLTYERLPMAAVGVEAPGTQARQYRICIGPERARAPMMPRRMPPAAELVFDGQSYTGSYDDKDSSQSQVDFSFRRLSPTAFEGSRDAAGQGLVARLQYFAKYGGPNCGATRPGGVADNGEP